MIVPSLFGPGGEGRSVTAFVRDAVVRKLADAEDPDQAYLELIRPTKLKLQLKYVRERSFVTDMNIILLTLLAVVRPEGRIVLKVREGLCS